MNAAAKELPVSYDLSKPQEDKEPYVGSVLFFKHVIFTVTLLLILIPTMLSIYLFAQCSATRFLRNSDRIIEKK